MTSTEFFGPQDGRDRRASQALSSRVREAKSAALLNAAAIDINTAAISDLQPGAWTDVTFVNSWANFGGSYQTVQYRKVADVVELRGVMAAGTHAAVSFTLPSGFRPPAAIRFAVAGQTTPTVGVCTVEADGDVTARMPSSNTTFIALDGVRFSLV